MKKTLIATALIASALSSQAFAGGDWFVGGEVGKARQDYSIHVDNNKIGSDKETNNHYGLRIGKQITDHVRVYGTLSGSKGDTKVGPAKFSQKNYQALISSDYLFGSGSVRPFVGLSVGANKMNIAGKTDTAAAYGAQAGVNWQIAKNWSVETGVQVLKHNNELKASAPGHSAKFKNDKTEKAYLSVQYQF